MSYLAAQFADRAKEAARVVTHDEERSKAFMEGVRWAVDQLERDAYNTHHPMASPSDNAYMDKLTMADLNRFVKKIRARDSEEVNK